MSEQFFKNVISETAENVQPIIAAENRARIQQEAEDLKIATTALLEYFARYKDTHSSLDTILGIIKNNRVVFPANMCYSYEKIEFILETLAQKGYLIKVMREKSPLGDAGTVMCYQYNSELLQN